MDQSKGKTLSPRDKELRTLALQFTQGILHGPLGQNAEVTDIMPIARHVLKFLEGTDPALDAQVEVNGRPAIQLVTPEDMIDWEARLREEGLGHILDDPRDNVVYLGDLDERD